MSFLSARKDMYIYILIYIHIYSYIYIIHIICVCVRMCVCSYECTNVCMHASHVCMHVSSLISKSPFILEPKAKSAKVSWVQRGDVAVVNRGVRTLWRNLMLYCVRQTRWQIWKKTAKTKWNEHCNHRIFCLAKVRNLGEASAALRDWKKKNLQNTS
jgi:hypothetical protein